MLNREKRRKFAKEAKAKGIPKEYIDAYLTTQQRLRFTRMCLML